MPTQALWRSNASPWRAKVGAFHVRRQLFKSGIDQHADEDFTLAERPRTLAELRFFVVQDLDDPPVSVVMVDPVLAVVGPTPEHRVRVKLKPHDLDPDQIACFIAGEEIGRPFVLSVAFQFDRGEQISASSEHMAAKPNQQAKLLRQAATRSFG
jgi:hypothetical protein